MSGLGGFKAPPGVAPEFETWFTQVQADVSSVSDSIDSDQSLADRSLDGLREVSRTQTTVTFEWDPGDDVHRIWLYRNEVSQPTSSDPWPTDSDISSLIDVVAGTTVQYQFDLPPQGKAAYLQIEPMAIDGQPGRVRRIVLLPLSDEPDRIVSLAIEGDSEDGSVDVRVEMPDTGGSYRYATSVGTSPSRPTDAAVESGTVKTISGVDEFTLAAGTVSPGERIRVRITGYTESDGTGPDGTASDHGPFVEAAWKYEGQVKSGNLTIDASSEQILFGSATAPTTGVGIFLGLDGADYEFRAGDPGGEHIHWDGTNLNITGTLTVGSSVPWSGVTDDDGGKPDDNADVTSSNAQNLSWLIASGLISAGNMDLDASNEQIRLGSATDPTTGVGVFLGLDGTDYEFRAGDPAGDNVHWDGSNLSIVGSITIGGGSGLANLSDSDADSISETGSKKWAGETGADITSDHASDVVFRQSSAPAHKTGRIWVDSDDSKIYRSTGSAWEQISALDALLLTNAPAESGADVTSNNAQDLSWLIASGLISAGNMDLDASNEQIRLGSATDPTTGVGVFLGKDGANYEFRAGDPSGDQIHWTGVALVVTGQITADSGTIGGWDIDSGQLDSGNVIISSDDEQILLGSATAPLTGTGIFLGKSGANYEFRAGDPGGEYIHWDGSSLTVGGTITSEAFTASTTTFGGEIKIETGQNRTLAEVVAPGVNEDGGLINFYENDATNQALGSIRSYTEGMAIWAFGSSNALALGGSSSKLIFFSGSPGSAISKPTVSGARDNSEQALANLLIELANLNLITDNTTAS